MSERRLGQVQWQYGQSSGDPVDGSAKKLLNCEVDVPGRLRPRGAINVNGSTSIGSFDRHWRIPGDPLESGSSSWDMYLNSSVLKLVSDSGNDVEFSLEVELGGAIDTERTSVWVNASGATISFWLADKVSFGGIYMLIAAASGSVGELPGASAFIDTEWHCGLSGEAQDGWRMTRFHGTKPTLVVKEVEICHGAGELGELTGGQCPGFPIAGSGSAVRGSHSRFNALVGEIVDEIGADRGKNILIVAKAKVGGGVFKKSPIVEYIAQYRYVNGAVSDASDPQQLSLSDYPLDLEDDETGWSLAATMVRSVKIDPEIESIRVYRRVIDFGSGLDPEEDFTLAYEFPATRAMIADSERDLGSFLRNTAVSDGEPPVNPFPYKLFNWWDAEDLWGVSNNFVASGSATAGSGWMRTSPGSQYAIYLADHAVVDGTISFDMRLDPVQMRYYNDTNAINPDITGDHGREWYRGRLTWGYSGKLLISNRGSIVALGIPCRGLGATYYNYVSARWIETARIRIAAFGDDTEFVDYPDLAIDKTPNDLFFPHGAVVSITPGSGFIRVDGQNIKNVSRVNRASGGYDISWNDPGEYVESSGSLGLPAVLQLDTGVPGIETLDSSLGSAPEDVVMPEAGAIANIGGRLFALNVSYGGASFKSRLLYTAAGRGVFSKSHFIDYAGVNEGFGVAIAYWRSMLLLFYSDAVYMLDISSGDELSWRQVGSVVASPPCNQMATCVTSSGVVWAGDDVYGVLGSEIRNLTSPDDRPTTMRSRYRELISGRRNDVTVHYLDVMNQVWVCVGSTALVLEMDRLTWHEHDFGASISKVVSLHGDDNGGATVHFLDSSGWMRKSEYVYAVSGVVGFDWGIEFLFDAGVPEVSKRPKSMHVSFDSSDAVSAMVSLHDWASGTGTVVNSVFQPRAVSRLSTSARGRTIQGMVTVRSGAAWDTMISSIGLVYKAKKLK